MKRITAALLCAVALIGCGKVPTEAPQPPASGSLNAPSPARPTPKQSPSDLPSTSEPMVVKTVVIRVIDGDTVLVEAVPDLPANTSYGHSVRGHSVRLLGIDAPELNLRSGKPAQCAAREAKNSLGSILPPGLPITVEYDPVADRTDRYGRSLVYVMVSGTKDAGEAQIRKGYASAWFPASEPAPTRYTRYVDAERQARSNHAGGQSMCPRIGR